MVPIYLSLISPWLPTENLDTVFSKSLNLLELLEPACNLLRRGRRSAIAFQVYGPANPSHSRTCYDV